jgi:dihydrofolate reductase
VDFLIMPPESQKMMAEFFATIDTILFGRKTLEARDKMAGGEAPAGPWQTYVFSRTLVPGSRCGITITNQTPLEFVQEIRTRPGKHIFHMGGGELARSFLEEDLVDELWLGIVPVLLGQGIPLFPAGFPQRNFKLTACDSMSRGLVSVKYTRVRPKQKRDWRA